MSMTAMKLQDFADGKTVIANAESSGAEQKPPKPGPDQKTIETMLAKARGKGRADGFAEGVAMAEARAESELRMVLSALSEQVSDLTLKQESVHQQIAISVQEITSVLFRAIAPALSDSILIKEIQDTVSDALRRAPSAKLVVTVSPERATMVCEALTKENMNVHVDEDPDLGSLGARIYWQGGYDSIDLQGCIDSALGIIKSHLDAATRHETDLPQERRVSNE